MKGATLVVFLVGTLIGAIATLLPKISAHVHAYWQSGSENHSPEESAAVALLHTEKQFEFVANAPMNVVAPLFGAWKEREWAPDWDPKLVWPAPAPVQTPAQSAASSTVQRAGESLDREGMVFTVKHGHAHAAWVNTQFDLAAGRIQYAYVVPDAMVTLITLHLTPEGDRTRVHVEYARTALDPAINAHVQQLSDVDANAGPEWEEQVNECLKKFKK